MAVSDPALARLLRRTDTVRPADELESRLREGRPLRVKLGLDPTAPAVTLGWAVVLRKLRDFQEQGHTAVLIVGDFTAQVGDPSQKSETRRRLSAEEVRGYALALLAQFEKVLAPEPLEIRYNSEWLAALDMSEVLELTSAVTVAQLLERGDFAKRYEAGSPISMMEFMYPLLQGYDSVAVEADVELGGSDQLWNLMMGRVIQERYGQRPQIAMTLPLLIGTDGVHKMSQSLGNYIGVEEPAAEMYGKVMSIPDHLLEQWFELATELSDEGLAAVREDLSSSGVNPRDLKRRLARLVVEAYWDRDSAEGAELAFDRVFVERLAPEDIAEAALPPGDPVHLPTLLRDIGLVASSSEAARLIDQRGVKVDGEPVGEKTVARNTLVGAVVQIGKRRFVRLVEAG
ncbi:MAG TPA: tyrosine--tRNA ligase [Acidimicrobiia bacterium]|nr:tyrosine--tRNA ligase [Acidimicrobiia bacterium]